MADHDTSMARSVMVGRRLVHEARRRGMVARRSWSFGAAATAFEKPGQTVVALSRTRG